jgi:hypothetical protein
VELRLTNAQDAVVWIDVCQSEAQQFAASQPRRVEQNHGEPHHGWSKRRVAVGANLSAICNLGRPEDDRRCMPAAARKAVDVGHEAGRLGALTVEAEIAHNTLAIAASVRGEMAMRCTPRLESRVIEFDTPILLQEAT